jgi:O-acetyl-ADP-ribose deacetylase (regulator of RNase III)
MRVEVLDGGVLAADAEALVNAANTELRHGGGVALAIARAAGEAFVRESEAVGYCPLGRAVCTGAGRLPARVVVHVPTIDYRAGGRRATRDELRQGVREALRLAAERGCRSIAFPILGAGIAGFTPEEACAIMAEAFRQVEAEGAPAPERVVVCAYSEADRRAVRATWGGTG